MIPRRRKKPLMGLKQSSVIRCPGHLKWVRGFDCLLNGMHDCNGKMHAHHVDTRGSGGGDEQVVPLCAAAHDEIHRIGRNTFRLKYGDIDLKMIAGNLWEQSPHGKKWRMEHG